MIENTQKISGKLDHVFLSLVTFDNNYLKEIIYEVLNIRIKKAKIINSKLAKKRIRNRANFLDLVVETEFGNINIEVNTEYDKYRAHRNFVYLNNLVTNVTKEGMTLENMPKVIQINLIFKQKPRKINTSKYNVYSKEEEKILTEKFEIYNVYVDKMKKVYYNNNNKLTYKPALMSLAMTKEELKKRKDENMFYEKLYAKLDEMEDTGLAPEIMSIEEEKEWYRRVLIKKAKEEGLKSGMRKGMKKGIQKGIERGFKDRTKQNEIKTVINMIKEKFDINTISKITGLSKNEIEKITANI